MAAARERRDYSLWRGCLVLATNCTRFRGETGARYRRRLLDRGRLQGRRWRGLLVLHGSAHLARCGLCAAPAAAWRAAERGVHAEPLCRVPCRLSAGLAAELVIALASKDVHTRDAAAGVVGGLEAFDAWQRGCHHCGRLEPAGAQGPERLRLCAACHSRAFCGMDCQKASWPTHKIECKQLAAL